MGNVACILMRDFKRMLKAPAAMIVAAALLVFPSIYTWYNVAAFWDPYESTGNLRVCVVNLDVGTETEMTGRLDVGEKICEELLANDSLDWITEDYDTAMEDLRAGNLYAVYVIPEDFSACLVSPLTGSVKSPKLQYFVNEKNGPVSPKITDVAADTLDQQINAMFVSTVSDKAVSAVDDALKKAKSDVNEAQSRVNSQMGEVKAAVSEARETLSNIQEAAESARKKVSDANSGMAGATTLIADSIVVFKDVSEEADAILASLAKIESDTGPKLTHLLSEVSDLTAKAESAAEDFSSDASKVSGDVGEAAEKIQPAIDKLLEVCQVLRDVAAALPDSSLVKKRLLENAKGIEARCDRLQDIVDEAVALSKRASDTSGKVAEAAEELNKIAQQASTSLEKDVGKYFSSVASEVSSSLSDVKSTCTELSATASGFEGTIEQARSELNKLDGLLGNCGTAALRTDDLLGDLQGDLDTLLSDIRLLANSGIISDLVEKGTLNAQSIADFMGSPTELKTKEFYKLNSYGSAMAPLFMNLTFWIGAFMLMVIFKLGVDSEGLLKVTLSQRYLARFIFFAVFVVLQAVICCAGTLVLGVQVANVPSFFLVAIWASLAYLSIIYSLSTTFRHFGQALCIILVFAQIPGGSGLYPVEMTDGFFRAVYPLFPFTYGIDAMREAIGGLYGMTIVHDAVVLGAFLVGSLVLGLVAGPLMSNVTRMTVRQVREGDLFNGENEETLERPYRLTQVLRVLTERDDYRRELESRYKRFTRWYPSFIRASIVLGVGVPIVLILLFALNAGEKVVLLSVFLVWLTTLFLLLVVLESFRDSFTRQLGLEQMSDEGLLSLFSRRNRMVSSEEGSGANKHVSEREEADDA